MNIRGAVWVAVYSLGSLSLLHAQTTWQSDIVIEGDLDVGTTANQGSLRVTGETGNSAGTALRVSGDGGVLFQGTSGTGTMPVVQNGPYFLWYPKKIAFKSGIGGFQDPAVGEQSFAFGGYATGLRSVAFHASASGKDSVAFSNGYSLGDYTFTVASGWAEGNYSAAIGSLSMSFGEGSLSMTGGTASGEFSTAFTQGVTNGDYSVAFGGANLDTQSWANGQGSIAIGGGSQANSYASVVIGAGTAEGNPTSWVPTDPQFVVGYGTGVWNDPNEVKSRNAFVVYKNGNINMPKRQGDILMGEFGNPE